MIVDFVKKEYFNPQVTKIYQITTVVFFVVQIWNDNTSRSKEKSIGL